MLKQPFCCAGMRRRPSSQAGLLATAPAALVASTASQVAAGAHGWRSGRQGRSSGPVETSDSSGTSRQTEGGKNTWSAVSLLNASHRQVLMTDSLTVPCVELLQASTVLVLVLQCDTTVGSVGQSFPARQSMGR